MKKGLLILMVLLIATPVFAQNRGVLANTFASWYQTTANTTSTVTFPYTVRDLVISNGSAYNLWVNLNSATFPNSATTQSGSQFKTNSATNPAIFIVSPCSDLRLADIAISGLTMTAGAASASPVSVIATY